VFSESLHSILCYDITKKDMILLLAFNGGKSESFVEC